MTELISGSIGDKGGYKVEFKNGALVSTASYDESWIGVQAAVKIPAAAVLDAIANAIPGDIDDKIIAFVKERLLQQKLAASQDASAPTV